MSKSIAWPDLHFPPINLYNAPKQGITIPIKAGMHTVTVKTSKSGSVYVSSSGSVPKRKSHPSEVTQYKTLYDAVKNCFWPHATDMYMVRVPKL